MKRLVWLFGAVLAAVLAAAIAQHVRYLEIRREIVGDRQPILYSADAFHVATLVELAPGQALLAATREWVRTSEQAGGTVVYAGKIATNALESAQLPDASWDVFLLTQFPSRDAYEEAAATPDYRALRSRSANSYALGMKRSPWLNAALPVAFLGIRANDVLRGAPSPYPFTRTPGAPASVLDPATRQRVIDALAAHADYGEHALVVMNFIQYGDAAQQSANSGYGRAMVGLMAELGYGPMHVGRAVTIEGDAEFDGVNIVYYPGTAFFADLIQSEFFASIIGGKQLADTASSPTVPLLPHL